MQAAVTAVRPMDAQYDPAVQAEQLDNPADDWKYPVPQLVQLVESEVPVEVRYVPAEQLVQLDKPLLSE